MREADEADDEEAEEPGDGALEDGEERGEVARVVVATPSSFRPPPEGRWVSPCRRQVSWLAGRGLDPPSRSLAAPVAFGSGSPLTVAGAAAELVEAPRSLGPLAGTFGAGSLTEMPGAAMAVFRWRRMRRLVWGDIAGKRNVVQVASRLPAARDGSPRTEEARRSAASPGPSPGASLRRARGVRPGPTPGNRDVIAPAGACSAPAPRRGSRGPGCRSGHDGVRW